MIEEAKHPDMCKPKKKRLKFDEIGGVHYVYNKKGEPIGSVSWHYDWKMYVWDQDNEIEMSWDCLQEVVDFMRMMEAVNVKGRD